MIRLLGSPAALRLAWCLVHFLWQGALLGLLAWGALAALRGRGPRLRYGVACVFLALCALAPVVTFYLTTPATSAPFMADTPLVLGLGSGPLQTVPTASGHLAWQARLASLLPSLLLGWMIGCALLGLRAVGGWFWLQRLRRSSETVGERWTERVQELAARSGIRRTVRLLQSARIPTPMALGILRPVILVPLGFFAQVDEAGAEAVLAHELAHLRRLDPLVNGLQCALETLLFFHPAVHFISRRVRTERECCCDVDAVMACGDAVLYVETLCRLDAQRGRPLSLALSARGGNLMERIKRLLAPVPPPRFALPVLAVALAALGATALLAQSPKKPSIPVAPSPAATPAPPALPSAVPTRPLPPPPPMTALDPWGEKGDKTPVQIEAKTLKEAIRKFAEARRLDPVIGRNIPDTEGPFVFRHASWRRALDNLVKSQDLVCVIQDGVLRVAYASDLMNEGLWASRLNPKAEPTPPAHSAQPAVPAPPAPEEPKATTTEYRNRSIEFVYWAAKEGERKMRFVARNATREEVMEALRKIELLAKADKGGERFQGEWKLPTAKTEKNGEWLTFTYDGVTPQSVRELHK